MKTIKITPLIFLLAMPGVKIWAQMCANSKDTIYGLNSITGSGSGQIVSINVNDAGAATIGSAAAGSANANGLGFSSFNGKFYFFNQTGGGTTEFISYVPLTGSKVVLAAPPATITTAQKIRSGTVDSAGTRYYTINPNAAVPYFYYYNISTDAWTTITSTFVDKNGNTVTDFKNLNSGDMTFDGAGNLWVLCSSTTQYALYKIKSPVPTSAVASITVDTIISIRANPITPVSFTGIAFNSVGSLYLSTGSGGGAGNNKLYLLSTSTSALTLIGTLPNGYGDDLTSCVYPVSVLPLTWVDFTVVLKNNSVKLTWKINEEDNVSGYDIEYSKDAQHWQTIGHVEKDYFIPGNLKVYNYPAAGYDPGNNYYRIVQILASGQKNISPAKQVNNQSGAKIYIGPNPAKDVIYFYNKDNSSKLLAQIFDQTGKLTWSTIVTPDQQSINIGHLSKGNFVLRLVSPEANTDPAGYQFIKW